MNKRLKIAYSNMKQRCYNKKSSHYKNYGGRGIKICDEWLNDYNKFEEWALNNGFDNNLLGKENSIDRIDVNGNYEPNNCRWVDIKTQCRNTTKNVWYNINDEKVLLTDSTEYFNMTSANIRKRQFRFNNNMDMIKNVPKYNMLGIIIQKDLNGNILNKYKTIKEIKEKYGYDIGNISNCLYNRRKSAYGFKWEYEINKYCDESKTNKRELKPKNEKQYNFILDNYTNGNMPLKEVAKALNITTGGLSNYIVSHNLQKLEKGKNGRPKTKIIEKEKDIIELINQNYKPRSIAYKLNIDIKDVYYLKQILKVKPA